MDFEILCFWCTILDNFPKRVISGKQPKMLYISVCFGARSKEGGRSQFYVMRDWWCYFRSSVWERARTEAEKRESPFLQHWHNKTTPRFINSILVAFFEDTFEIVQWRKVAQKQEVWVYRKSPREATLAQRDNAMLHWYHLPQLKSVDFKILIEYNKTMCSIKILIKSIFALTQLIC